MLHEANIKLKELSDNSSKTVQSIIHAANGVAVSLDHVGMKSKLAAYGVQALNAAFSATIIGLISFAISGAITLIDNYIRRVEIAHEATAQKIADHEKQKSSIASLNDSLDGNYGMYN